MTMLPTVMTTMTSCRIHGRPGYLLSSREVVRTYVSIVYLVSIKVPPRWLPGSRCGSSDRMLTLLEVCLLIIVELVCLDHVVAFLSIDNDPTCNSSLKQLTV